MSKPFIFGAVRNIRALKKNSIHSQQKALNLIQKSFQQHVRTLQVMGLTRTEMKTRRIAEGITGCLDFGRQTSAGATDTFLGAITFFAPALC